MEGKKLAEILQEKLSGVMEQESRREAKGNTSYYLLKKTDCPLTIVEHDVIIGTNQKAC